ncbi:MAG TPA: hypothetical protein VGJ86_21900 [Acidimicrobiales bacterium]|jgi:hypothetical protein
MTGPDDVDVEVSPLGESGFAVEHGLVGSTPDVAVVGASVRQAREDAGLTVADVARTMSGRGYPTSTGDVTGIEEGPVSRLQPRRARLLAAIFDLPLAAIEAAAEPWSGDRGDLAAIRDAGVDALVLGADVVVRTETGSYLGVLRCPGDPKVLGSRTYRLPAATLLNGSWSHLAGALLVTEEPPYWALAVDALDCVTRSHAPTGLSGFSRLAEPEPIAEAVAAYDRAYSINWSDPAPLRRDPAAPDRGDDDGGDELVGRLAGAADDLVRQARRARQAGKRQGFEAAAVWLRGRDADEVAALLEDLASLPSDLVQQRLREGLEP